jgi:hypothetical protein
MLRVNLTDNESNSEQQPVSVADIPQSSATVRDIDLQVPENMPSAHSVSYADVLDKALENNSFALNIRRRQLGIRLCSSYCQG